MAAAGGIIGYIEAVTAGGIEGWALRPGDAGPLRLVLVVDDVESVPFVCDGVRADVWAARTDLHAGCGHGPHLGFVVPLPAGCFDGQPHHFDIVTATGVRAGLVAIGLEAVFCFARHAVEARARVVEGGRAVHGWVVVRDRMTGETRVRNEIEVVAESGWRGRVTADGVRSDVVLDQGCAPECGFELEVPEAALERGRGVLRFSVVPEGLAFAGGAVEVVRAAADDDGGLRFSGVARSALYGIGDVLDGVRAGLGARVAAVGEGREYAADPERTVAREFDRDYYLETYRDVRAGGSDPVLHYVRTGWYEGRRPAPWFDSAYYLSANPDVREAGVNPFWHFLTVGRGERRAPQRAGGQRRAVIEGLAAEGAGTEGPASAMRLLPGYLAGRLAKLGGAGLVLAVTEEAAAGAFLARERAGFAGAGWHYLEVAPAAAGMVRLALDGDALGVARGVDVAAGLAGLAGMAAGGRVMVVHSVVGHDLDGLIALREAAGGGRDFLWLHDFSALCSGGTLLRNDVVFCGAPGAGSNACLVCVHGEGRGAHLAGLRRLFAAGDFTVVAPSAAAAAMWRAMSPFAPMPVVEVAPYEVEERAMRVGLVAPGLLGSRAHPVRVAFVGGDWAGFRGLLERVGRLGCYRFFHVPDAAMTVQDSGRTEALAEGVLEEVLAAAGVDLVLVMPAGPEVFSRAALAALTAGADVVTLAESRHAADVVLGRGRGVVAVDQEAMVAFFESLRAVVYARLRAAAGAVGGGLVVAGTTAGLVS